MYDEYAQELISILPDLPGLDHKECRRMLSKAYFYVLRSRISFTEDEQVQQDKIKVALYLRRITDTLESVAIFDRLNGLEVSREVQNACAFVAGEALALLSYLNDSSTVEVHNTDKLLVERVYTSIESALLYMIGGYDINASSMMSNIVGVPNINRNDNSYPAARVANSIYLVRQIISLCRGEVEKTGEHVPFTGSPEAPNTYGLIVDEVRIRIYEKISHAINHYFDWLSGDSNNGITEAFLILNMVINATKLHGIVGFSDIYHLSNILLAAIDKTSERSVIHNVPRPTTNDPAFLQQFEKYLKQRVKGSGNNKGRPFLWPSAIEYIKDCLPGPKKDCVIAFPTGSGKSFVAELAVAHAVAHGWVLYLAPTNALAHQIRRDLKSALEPFNINIASFVGGEEYTILSEEHIEEEQTVNYVAVMTPEKCALALRIYPERFKSCSLCVFDECHLINDQHRGITSDIVIAQLINVAPNIRFLLMSAIISNPEQLSNWLNFCRKDAISKKVKWRPTRTLRGLLVLNRDVLIEKYQQSKEKLDLLPSNRKNLYFETPLALISGLSGPWTLDGPPDYKIISIPISFKVRASRKPGESHKPQYDSWKNTSSRQLSELFAKSGLPVINFILTSKHHAFSSANNIEQSMPGCLGNENHFPSIVDAWLSIADKELGVESVLRRLLRKGIAVHTSAMLQPEQSASEWMFANQKALLMFATGTLAQGLNLPAIAVVVAGTSMGDPRDTDAVHGISRVNAIILNGFGRASRPGFSNQGIAVLVTDNPYNAKVIETLDPTAALNSYGVLGESDAAVEVRSPLESFLDSIMIGGIDPQNATLSELKLSSLLAEAPEENNNAGQILSHTLAAYYKRSLITPQMTEQLNRRIESIKDGFLQQPNVPPWMNTAAMKAGVDFFRAWRMWAAYMQRGLVEPSQSLNYSVIDWLNIFIDVMSIMPPKQIINYVAEENITTETVLTKMRDALSTIKNVDFIPWDIPDTWPNLWGELKEIVLLYMQGHSYAQLAHKYLGISFDDMTNSRSKGDNPIPSIFKFLGKVVDQLAIDAGCFLALIQFSTYGDNESIIPEALQSLPLCIKNGCHTLGVLSWYRFGFRQRVCAHALEQYFPVPIELTSDKERANWVRRKRRQWLESDDTSSELLNYSRTIIIEGGMV